MSAHDVTGLQQLAIHVVQKTAFLPGLLSMSIGARSSLKSWLAVKDAPAAPRLDKDEEKRLRRKMIAIMVVTVTAVLGLELYLFAQRDTRTLDRFFTYLFGYLFQVALMSLLVEVTHATEWSAHRGAPASLVFRPFNINRARFFVATAAATAVNVAAFYNVHWTCYSAIMTAVLVQRVSSAPGRTFSLRGSILYLLGLTALCVALMTVATFAVMKIDSDDTSLPTDVPDEKDSSLAFVSPHVMRYLGAFVSAFYAALPAFFVAGCYRFDHANAVEAAPESFAPVPLRTVDAPRRKRGSTLSTGVILPSSVPEHFARPYYTLALWSWMLSHVVTSGILSLALPIPETVFDNSLYPVLSFLVSSTILVIAICTAAAFRGEFGKMWRYKEVWIPETDKGITLDETTDSESATGANDEILPAYDDSTVKAVDVESKQPLLAEQAPAYEN
ncbi:uncharacterized protein JCM15063_000430 [Sporobolomyces koalae]|uniref:uncharacterized protein n=1 Tax=Sporobolomyces koalae TaxID=500713 RepID=UPI00318037D2